MFYAPECPYPFKGRPELSFEERFEVLVNNVNHSKVCTKHPLRVQENAVFVIQRSALKHRDDWLVTDLGSFDNKGQSGRVFKVEGEEVISTRRWPRRVEERFRLEDDEYLVLSTYWRPQSTRISLESQRLCRRNITRNLTLSWSSIISKETSTTSAQRNILDRNDHSSLQPQVREIP